MSDAWFERPVLTGRYVRLAPLALDHAEGLFAAGKDPGVWTWLGDAQPADVEGTRAIIREALDRCEERARLPWVQIERSTGEVAGTTSFYEIEPFHRRLCIGYTWLGARWHRTGINTEAKLLLLGRAFDELGACRVGWHTDALNERSRAAIQRLGASFEGVHRKHRLRPDGTMRDTATYAMIDTEWPAARDALGGRLR
ncbi:GNAT family N-acetyltransferase [Spirillospora sp. CA-294931]|uniref:GNAT family N-acetyltransferase n=1 Tax=Spirillospora sp. CA-294931 TaxID=3240042 RepID=UPI003D9407F1